MLNSVNQIDFEAWEKWYKAIGFAEHNDSSKSDHEYFWEVAVAKILDENKIKINKEEGEAKPDFYLNYGDKKIHIEATVSNSGKDDNHVKSLDECSNDIDFMSGIRPDNKIQCRLTHSIHNKIKQYNRRVELGTIAKEEPYVLALNGYAGINGWSFPFKVPDIVEILFQAGCEGIARDGQLKYNGQFGLEKHNGTIVHNNYFLDINTPFHGILYSEMARNNFNILGVNNIIYIQNPLKEDLSHIFKQIKDIDIYKAKIDGNNIQIIKE